MRAFSLSVLLVTACGGHPHELAIEPIVHGQSVDVSVAILRGDDVVYVRDAERVYPLASLSKLFWATGIAQLAEDGKLNVDAPVADVLELFPDRRVTVRHLLTQTSGLGDDKADEDDERFFDLPALAFEPGSWWLYSNRGSLVARRVLETVAHQPWSTYLATRIAGPLALHSLRVCDAEDAPLMPAETMERVAFVCANALDTARFVRALDQGTLVDAHTLARMRRATRIGTLDVPYGWFTRMGDVDGHRAFGHTGNFAGVSVAAYTFPDDKLTIAVLTRGSTPPAWDLLTQIARAALDLPAPTLPNESPPTSLVRQVIGTYAAGNMTVRISDRSGDLYGQILEPAEAVWEGELVWLGGTSFAGGPHGADPDQPVTFILDGDHAAAFTIGHRLMIDLVFRRLDARVPSESDADGADVP